MNDLTLLQGDCLELMKDIPDGSVDMILTDPPYNIGKAAWDRKDNYISWCIDWIKECERVLKKNGSLYFWHNDMVLISQLMEAIRINTTFVFNSFCIWDKGNFRALSWKNPSKKNKLRSWFNVCEFCLYFTFQDETGLKTIDDLYVKPRNPFRNEIMQARLSVGMTVNEVAEKGKFYGKVNHGGSVSNWEKGANIPTKEQYEILKTFLPLHREYEDLRREYEDLRREYEDLRFTHNLDKNHKNIWTSTEKRNDGKLHVCKKPVDILERIVKTSSNEGDVVLDCFMGSGSTGVACINTGRKFIGMELDKGYFDIACKRIAEAQKAVAIVGD